MLLGLSAEEIRQRDLAIPYKNYFPKEIEGRLLCWGDRFHSKHPLFNRYDTFKAKLSSDLPLQAEKMDKWAKEFGIPDVEALAKKYGHPIK